MLSDRNMVNAAQKLLDDNAKMNSSSHLADNKFVSNVLVDAQNLVTLDQKNQNAHDIPTLKPVYQRCDDDFDGIAEDSLFQKSILESQRIN